MSSPFSLNLIRHLGLIGSAGSPSGSIVPPSATPQSAQRQLDDFTRSGDVADPDIWSRYSSMMKRPVSFDSMLSLWEEMSGWDLMAAALSEIVNEAIQTDPTSPGTLWYECNDAAFEDSLNSMLLRVKSEDLLPSQVYHVASMGNNFERIEYEPDFGVLGFSYAHPMDVRRYWLERNRRCIGFRWNGRHPNKDDAYVMPDGKTPIQRVALNSGQGTEDLYYPWDFLHMRRMFRLRMTEHGEPIFEEAQGIYKKLRLALDQMVVHRAQVQPDRYSINIDVKDQPPIEQVKTVNRWKQSLRSKLAFGDGGRSEGLNSPTGFSAFYNAMALDTVLWLAKPNGFSHTVEKLSGTANVPDVYDIELLTDLFYSIIGMPKSWFGVTKDQGEAPSGKALLAQDIRFLRKIKSIRRPVINAYTWLGYFHAALQKKDVSTLDIRAKMSSIGSLEDQTKLEVLKAQTEVLTSLGDVMDRFSLPREAWIDVIFKRYMHLPDDVVNVFLTALPPEANSQEESRKTREPAPSTYRLIREVMNHLDGSKEGANAVRNLKASLYSDGESTDNHRRKEALTKVKSIQDVYNVPEFMDNDLIVSSFGSDPFQYRSDPSRSGSTKKYSTMVSLNESDVKGGVVPKVKKVILQTTNESKEKQAGPGYRRFIG